MKQILSRGFLALTMGFGAGQALSEETKTADKEDTPHCEKKDKDGNVSHIDEAKDKKTCKQKGGIWVTKKDHGHKEGDGHKHD